MAPNLPVVIDLFIVIHSLLQKNPAKNYLNKKVRFISITVSHLLWICLFNNLCDKVGSMHKKTSEALDNCLVASGTSHFLDSTPFPFLLERKTYRQKMNYFKLAICQKFSQNRWSEAVQKLCLFSTIKLYHMGEHSESVFSQWSTVDDEKLYHEKKDSPKWKYILI